MIPRRIDTQRIIEDIKFGMGDIAIMEKYLISADELMAILTKLEKAQAVAKEEVQRRMPALKAEAEAVQKRTVPRNYIFLAVRVHDIQDPKLAGVLTDISLKGLQVTGIETRVGDIRRFFFQSPVFRIEPALVVEAVCRWIKPDEDTGETVAGFELKRTSKGGKGELQRLIQELTIKEAR